MARPLRIEYEGAVYHITARGNERGEIYFTKKDYKKFLEYVAEAERKFGILLHCYVLMSNHYHLILETPKANLSKTMHYINSSYTTYINIKRKRAGHLFQGRYKAMLVSKDNYMLELSRYIHLNPVRAGIVKKPEEYVFSSYSAFVTGKIDEVVTTDLIFGLIKGKNVDIKKEYRKFVEASIGDEELYDFFKDVYGGIILGGQKFIKYTLRNIKEEYLQRDSVSQRTALKSAYEIEEVINIVSKHYGLRIEDIIRNKFSEQRKIVIYLMKERTGTSNRQIGEFFGGISFSAVAKVYQRFKKDIEANMKIRRKVRKIERELSYVKA
jgi:REP element-mobilizing transposase RayT